MLNYHRFYSKCNCKGRLIFYGSMIWMSVDVQIASFKQWFLTYQNSGSTFINVSAESGFMSLIHLMLIIFFLRFYQFQQYF